jgi:peptide/nickel transport system permease protein
MTVQAPDLQSDIAPPPAFALEQSSRFKLLLKSLELWGPLGFLVLMALACFVWPEIHRIPSPIDGLLGAANIPPLSPHHLLGTDPLGNDVLSRLLYGGRVSLVVGFGSVGIGMVAGGFLGTVAGFRGGAIEVIVMRILDMFLAFPSLVLAIVVANVLGPSELHVIWAISFFSVPAFGRLARANTLRLREHTFVVASKTLGTKSWRIIARHIVPNIFPQLMTFALLGVSVAIIAEAALSFLGLGVPPPGPSWGNMIAAGQQNLTTQPDLVIIPSAFLFATVIALNLMGDALRTRWSTV